MRLVVELVVAVEQHARAGGPEHVAAQVEVDLGRLEHGGVHLRRHEAPPDQLVQLELLGVEVLLQVVGAPQHVGRADRLVRVLHPRLAFAGLVDVGRGGEVALVELARDEVPRLGHRRVRDADRVGAHVGDQPDGPLGADLDPLVQLLGQAHRDRGRIAQLFRRFLLQRAGAERRGRRAAALALLDGRDLEGQLERVRDDGLRARLILDLGLVAVELVQPGLERLPVLFEVGLDGPVFLRHEPADLLLPLADQPQRHCLHPARRQARLDALPEQRRGLVADQPVEHAPRLLRVDFLLVDVEGIGERLRDGVLGDLMEQHAAHLAAAVAQALRHVPGDGLALPVGVGRDQHPLGRVGGFLDLGERLRLLLDRHVLGREAVVHIHAELALGEVADVPHGRFDRVATAQVLADRLRLGG